MSMVSRLLRPGQSHYSVVYCVLVRYSPITSTNNTVLYLPWRKVCKVDVLVRLINYCSGNKRVVHHVPFTIITLIPVAPIPRIKQEAEQETPTPAIDIARHAALLAEKNRSLNASTLTDGGINTDAVGFARDVTSTQRSRRLGGSTGRPARRRKRHDLVNTEASCCFSGPVKTSIKDSQDKTKCATPARDGKPVETRLKDKNGACLTKAPLKLAADNSLRAAKKRSKITTSGWGDSKYVCGVEVLPGTDRERQQPDAAISNEGQRADDPETTNEYLNESFESEDDAESGGHCGAANSSAQQGVGDAENTLMSNDDGVGHTFGNEKFCPGGAAADWSKDAAALKIEACWRGFLGACTAKFALRSVLLNALRKIGGGKVSKVGP